MRHSLILLLVLSLLTSTGNAKSINPILFPLKHPLATAVLAAGGYATIKSYCAAGAPVAEIDDGSGNRRLAKLDCSAISHGGESVLGDLSENVEEKGGLLARMKNAIARNTTAELRKNLNADLVATGQPPDPDDCDAHHIVPKSEARPWALSPAKAARDAINGCVDIDDADNGVYLPGKKVGPFGCFGAYHKTLHTAEYYRFVAKKLGDARSAGGCGRVRTELRAIKQLLQSGSL